MIEIYYPETGRGLRFEFSRASRFDSSQHGLIALVSEQRWFTATDSNLIHILGVMAEAHNPDLVRVVVRKTSSHLPASVAVPQAWDVLWAHEDLHAYLVPGASLGTLWSLFERIDMRARWFISCLPKGLGRENEDVVGDDLTMEFLLSPKKDGRSVVVYDTDDDFLFVVLPDNAPSRAVTSALIRDGWAQAKR